MPFLLCHFLLFVVLVLPNFFGFLKTSVMIFLLFLKRISSLVHYFIHGQSALGEIASLSFYFIDTPIMNILHNFFGRLEIIWIRIISYLDRTQAQYKWNGSSMRTDQMI